MLWHLLGLSVPEKIFETRKQAVEYWNAHSGYDVLVSVPTV